MSQNLTENPYWDGFVVGGLSVLMLLGGIAMFVLAGKPGEMMLGLFLALFSVAPPIAAAIEFRKRAAKLVPIKIERQD
jgi:hypothetical protein